ncbi:hypothetical protein RHO12_06720 [Orbus sturtevantii]|uniref:hypothetical protein n=1 Tax=Orbus sturtevantii TaxID=3074109 RepID=UPI00370D9F6C
MKDKKLIILYVLMLVIGFTLLFSNSSPKTENQIAEAQAEKTPLTEMVTIAVAKRDIPARTIITPADYYFKTIEVTKRDFDKTQYVLTSSQINQHVVKNNIEEGTMIQHNFVASPNSREYLTLSLKAGEYIFPIDIEKEDAYLLNNLKTGDLIDIYVVYGVEQSSNRNDNEITLTSPSRNFSKTNIKPLIMSKKILFIENEMVNTKQNLGRINLALSNDEIKLVRTLMTNSTIVVYPSTFTQSLDDGMIMLGEQEKGWPLSERQILNYKQINKLRGN